ncbi:DUF3726 domain-containing protein [Rhodobacteraceae bacterium B1Z28]|uniref:DUF3726 domain-containing protein n=1 Tax=Ruegeria haliotis TaxID=2747601 RepID=A0ABX2PSV8_9RHOB|nr:DUF3726 domain-containing protein [Ruegeria haliotis]NVO56746.1 DUF3726 domain-containing protein [Ruegeria haliotis]
MNLSLNEIEAIAKRAARGAGYEWGVAEEAGKATRWLCAQGLDGATELARLLQREFPVTLEQHVPSELNDKWAGEEALCPLMTGATLSDHADIRHPGPLELQHVAVPLLLLPFVANMAFARNNSITMTMDGCTAVTDGTRLSCPDCDNAHADHVVIAVGGVLENTRPCHTRAHPDPAAWQVLTSFAHRTYAPATEESRLLGAGAGLSDND